MTTTTKRSLLGNLLVLSRFHKYNPLFATFAACWSALLAGATRLADQPSSTSLDFIFRQTALCFLATYIFCGAGMVWNDWIDRDIDANVARTKDRPLAAGDVTTTQAMLWMGLQVIVSWYLLHVILDGKDTAIHGLPIVVGTILYPFGKRPMARKLFIYPQYILGFTIAWPAVPAWAAIYGHYQSFAEIARQCFPLCVMIFFWVVYLNTAYSYQDVVDDRKMNVNSFYNLAGQRIHHLLVALITPILACMLLFLHDFHSLWLWMAWMGLWFASFARQLARFDPKQPASGGTLHKSNFTLGIWTIIACVIEVFLKGRVTPTA